MFVINGNHQPRLHFPQGALRAFQGISFPAFNIHFDDIHAQIPFLHIIINRNKGKGIIGHGIVFQAIIFPIQFIKYCARQYFR